MFVGVRGLPDNDIDIGLSLLDGMLCFHITTEDDSLGTFKLWAMKVYGVKESWIVLFTIQVDGLAIAKPKYRFSDGNVLLYSPGEFDAISNPPQQDLGFSVYNTTRTSFCFRFHNNPRGNKRFLVVSVSVFSNNNKEQQDEYNNNHKIFKGDSDVSFNNQE
ncbi:hypothetical protein BC332_17826 [Capsicum chinense]|nr:hypothetical protein BC332_17826 [Capsicum chinense]